MKRQKKLEFIMKLSVFFCIVFALTVLNADVSLQVNAISPSQGKLVDIPKGVYTIKSVSNSKYVLDVYGGRTTNGTNIAVYASTDKNNQKFIITKVKSKWYKIEAVQSGKVLDVKGGKKGNGVNIQLYEYNGTDSQLFQFYQVSSGKYFIKNKLGYFIDITGGKAQQGANVHTWKYHGGKQQQWMLQKTKVKVEFDISKAKKVYPDKSVWTGSYKGAGECHGWALSAANKVTGSDPLRWKKVYNLNSIKAGDIIRFNHPHTILVTDVNGKEVTYADCNWYKRNTVKYNQKIQKSKLTKKFGSLVYVLVRP